MSLGKRLYSALSASALLLGAMSAAHADVAISADPTSNMSCSGGVCTPTAADAVLNVSDLESYLASGSLEVTTTGSGVQANNIDVTAPFAWSAANTLTLDAYDSITVTGAVTDSGAGGVALDTNDGGSGGALSFVSGGALTITNLKDALTINGTKYKLEKDIKGLAYDIVKHAPDRAFAMANDYDAKKDGIYRSSPVPLMFEGAFNGLGHVIANLEIADSADSQFGFFYEVQAPGTISSVGLENVVVRGTIANAVGGLVGELFGGTVSNSWTSGTINGGYSTATGGLAGYVDGGLVSNSWSSAHVVNLNEEGVGGLIGYMTGGGIVSGSFATGRVSKYLCVGGLVGYSEGSSIMNSYAIGPSIGTYSDYDNVGGFVGCSISLSISDSYSTGRVKGATGAVVGGFIGSNSSSSYSNCYWDKQTSKVKTGTGTGGAKGVVGLTTAQFQSGLPVGFNATIWAEDPSINNGFPYLIANPPPQ
jgi:GLUG motif-containing protein